MYSLNCEALGHPVTPKNQSQGPLNGNQNIQGIGK